MRCSPIWPPRSPTERTGPFRFGRRHHPFAAAASGVGFSFGYAVDVRGRDAVGIRNATDGWHPAIEVREVSAHPGTRRQN